jgi:hypothetical protein
VQGNRELATGAAGRAVSAAIVATAVARRCEGGLRDALRQGMAWGCALAIALGTVAQAAERGAASSGARVPDVGRTPVVFAAPPGDSAEGDGSRLRPHGDLQRAVDAVRDGGTVRLMPGHYRLRAMAYEDSTCANCQRPDSLIHATRALLVRGQGVRLVGAAAGRTVLETGAGYGVLFEGCTDCAMESLTVTGGTRDTSGMASDAAVVVKRGKVSLRALHLSDNLGDSAEVRSHVVGIMGVTARDGAMLTVRDCRIVRNSWDGIALYRGAKAVIEDNWVDGVDLAIGGRHGGGRGVGIGVTWDARAEVRGNAVRRYWKGIGAFVDAHVVAEENVVEEIATWGMTLWDAGQGRPHGTFRNNAIYRTGACGIAVYCEDRGAPEPGAVLGNALVETGQNERYDKGDIYCTQRALALDLMPSGFRVESNLRHANREAGNRTSPADADSSGFAGQVRPLVERLGRRPALRETAFVRRFGAGGGSKSH